MTLAKDQLVEMSPVPTAAELLQGLKDLIQCIDDTGVEELEHNHFGCEDEESCALCKARNLIDRAETMQCNAADAMFATLQRCEASLTLGSAADPEIRDVILADIRKSLSAAGWQAP